MKDKETAQHGRPGIRRDERHVNGIKKKVDFGEQTRVKR